MADFASRLRDLRAHRQITLKELGDYVGVSSSSIGYYEQGKRQPSLDQLQALCDYFNVSMDYLMGKDDVSMRLLTEDELILLDAYRRADEQSREMVRRVLAFANIEKDT